MKTLITIISIAVTITVTLALVGCSVRPARPARPQTRELECFGAAGDNDVCHEWAEYREAMGENARAEVLRLHAERRAQ